MAIINFPDTTGQPTDGSFTYTFEDVLYSWTGTYWAANSQSGFDSRYVEVAGDTMTGDLTVPSLNGGPLAGFRNQLINSTFRFWQRGTPPLAGASTFTADRWYTNSRAGNVARQVQNTPPGTSFGLKVSTINSANLGIVQIRQGIELPMGGEFYDIPTAGQFAVGSVWTTTVWSTQPVSLSLSFADSVTVNNKVDLIPDKSIMVDTGETSGDYTKYTFTSAPITDVPLSDSKCLLLRFTAEFTDVSDTWIIAQPQLEPGPVATPFEHRPVATELALCQRYFFRNDNLLVAPMTNTSNSNKSRNISVLRPVAMRVTPTEVIPAPTNGSVDGSNPSAQVIRIAYTANSATANISFRMDYTADAEL